ncbi:MAG: hypothetical protein A4E52_00088 [Pelotomaculum sp. PtaB.Bin013]|nr:MAG: hypothetical protein A4E52_00088 [Pelotomaculum sp. PtaB.Bin013]
MDMLTGIIMPPPTAWITLAATKELLLQANPQIKEPAVNETRENMYMLFIPKRSPRYPVTGTTTPDASR